MIEIKVANKTVLAALDRLSKAAANLRPALLMIGEHLTKTTKARFDTSTAPDGTKWKPNKESTYLQQLVHSKGGMLKSLHGDSGRINAAGERKIISKSPLVDKGTLGRSSISYYLSGGDLFWGSSMKYAAMQQFGGDKSRFPNLWGDIPARPFLGVSSDDETKIISIVNDFLRGAIVS